MKKRERQKSQRQAVPAGWEPEHQQLQQEAEALFAHQDLTYLLKLCHHKATMMSPKDTELPIKESALLLLISYTFVKIGTIFSPFAIESVSWPLESAGYPHTTFNHTQCLKHSHSLYFQRPRVNMGITASQNGLGCKGPERPFSSNPLTIGKNTFQ